MLPLFAAGFTTAILGVLTFLILATCMTQERLDKFNTRIDEIGDVLRKINTK